MIFHNLQTQVTAFSTTRNGGVSKGDYASMNCTPYTGDDLEAVQRNQQLLCTALHIEKEQLIIPYQTHSVNALVIDKEFLQQNAEKQIEQLQNIDALITQEKGVCLCVSTADCTPILLYDRKQQVIAAIHAGWRGSVNYIVRKTLEQMNRLYNTQGEDIFAAIGPCIGFDAFEVGDEVYDAFKQNDFPMEYISGWKPETHKWHIDLQMANSVQLIDFGVPTEQIDICDICTFTHYEKFFSARRLGIKSGRILSGIFMKF
ncbi:MAG: peptidoglycan editing factor PgeF [Bacteroides sp.]|nr:peptidoglycan editing factor PgeF [Bacteroides sp.]